MKTLKQIQDDKARSLLYDDWEDFISLGNVERNFSLIINEVMEEYSSQFIEILEEIIFTRDESVSTGDLFGVFSKIERARKLLYPMNKF